MVIDVWSWDAKQGMAQEATDWAVKAANLFNKVGDARAKVIRPKSGSMMAVYFVTMAESQAILEDCWTKQMAGTESQALLKEHAKLFDQSTSSRHQYREIDL
jgi:hypothetical protein